MAVPWAVLHIKKSPRICMLSVIVFTGFVSVLSELTIANPPDPSSSIEEQFSFFTTMLSKFDCDLDQVLEYVKHQKRTSYVELAGPAIGGGFGAQLCLHWIPKAMASLGFGSRVTFNVGELPWNYGCPEHETASDVLLNVYPSTDTEKLFHKFSNKPIQSIASEKQFPSPLVCNGKEITTMMVRAALANYYFKFEAFFEAKIRDEILKVKLPSPSTILAVHVRGGDKMVSEWRMASSLSDPALWALKIKTVIANERSYYKADILEDTVFVESDDCNLMYEVKKALDKFNIKMIHLPCALMKPVQYIQKGHIQNITGHHQNNWNKEHSCIDIIKYFTGLTIFKEASTVLLGAGGDQGYPLPGTGATSNTALLIELLREGYSQNHPTKRTYNIQGQPRGTLKYPNGTLSNH